MATKNHRRKQQKQKKRQHKGSKSGSMSGSSSGSPCPSPPPPPVVKPVATSVAMERRVVRRCEEKCPCCNHTMDVVSCAKKREFIRRLEEDDGDVIHEMSCAIKASGRSMGFHQNKKRVCAMIDSSKIYLPSTSEGKLDSDVFEQENLAGILLRELETNPLYFPFTRELLAKADESKYKEDEKIPKLLVGIRTYMSVYHVILQEEDVSKHQRLDIYKRLCKRREDLQKETGELPFNLLQAFKLVSIIEKEDKRLIKLLRVLGKYRSHNPNCIAAFELTLLVFILEQFD